MKFKITGISLRDKSNITIGSITYNKAGWEVWTRKTGFLGTKTTLPKAKIMLMNYAKKIK